MFREDSFYGRIRRNLMIKVYRSSKAQSSIQNTYDKLIAKWDVRVDEIDIPTSYGNTHIIACGEETNPPLVLFHGVGDDSALMWVFNAKALSEQFRVYAVDTIGGPGKSTLGEGYNKGFDDVLWIDKVLEGLNLKKSSFMGVSHGGYLVQLYTLHRPDKVDKAICLSAAVPIGESGNPMKTMMKIFLPEVLFPTKNNVKKLLKKLSGANYSVFTEDKLIMEHYTSLIKGFNNMAMRYHKVSAFSEEEVDRIRDKVYYLVGIDDPFEQMGGALTLKNYRMNVKFYDSVGHGINHEISDEINQIVLKLLQGKITELRNIS